MIRIPIAADSLLQRLEQDYEGWIKWSQIKPLFLDLQHYKCAFCESEIGGRPEEDGRRELHGQDVEHYRPKKRVVSWTPPDWEGPELKVGPTDGYPWLALNPLNYLASCKACNSGRKRNYFPIARDDQSYDSEPDPELLRTEEPYLLFPFGELEAGDPESMIAFLGHEAIPNASLDDASHEYWRARVTISLLGLNRQDVATPRKRLVVKLARDWCVLRLARPDDWQAILAKETLPQANFSSCAKCFLGLCEGMPRVAQRVALEVGEQLGAPKSELDILRSLWPEDEQ